MSTYVPTTLVTADGENYRVYVKSDVKEYFSIPDAAEGLSAPKLKTRESYTRQYYPKGLQDGAVVAKTKVKQTVLIQDPNRRNDIRAGQKIKVPTEEYSLPPSVKAGATTKGSLRYVTISVPQGCRNYDIARWIRTQFSAHTPNYFITPRGARYSTLLDALPAPAK